MHIRSQVLSSRTIVTIDGLAASGKSTLAKLLAKELNFMHLNTGLLYRGCAYLGLKAGLAAEDQAGLVELILKHRFVFKADPAMGSTLLIDGQACEQYLQTQEVSTYTSRIAALPEVREHLKELQKKALEGHSIVAEGRDTGTVIFPEAQVKFFVEGDPLIRASRRAKDLMGALSEHELQRVIRSVAQDLKDRDDRDANRATAPLKKADDAIIIDNTTKSTLEETVSRMVELVRSRLATSDI